MTYLSLAEYTHFDNPRVVAKIRRTILAEMAGGHCVCVLLHDAKELSETAKAEILRGWPPNKVKFSITHPSATTSKERQRRTKRSHL